MLWCFARQFIRAPAGRQRFNVLGALNAITHEMIMVTNDTYINAGSVCELLRRAAALGLNIPITFILDNARYQKCRLVFDLAASLRWVPLVGQKMVGLKRESRRLGFSVYAARSG